MLGGNNFGVVCGDIDDDGDMDVMFTTIVRGDVGSGPDPHAVVRLVERALLSWQDAVGRLRGLF